MKTITVFTPSFNRAYCLHRCYESLIIQSNKDFLWLIIDDGSSDNTKEIVEKWIVENKIEIIYYYQQNQGMHGAHNTAYELITTPLNVCIDSDDYMPIDAVQDILSFWENAEKNDKIAGIIGLDSDKKKNEILGKKFPDDLNKTTLEDLYHKHKIPGDKKIVLRTEVVKKYDPYPVFKDERFVPLGILYLLIDKDYEMLCLNKTLCIVEYLEDGSSRNILKQYYKHPKGFRHARTVNMKYSKYFKVKFKNAIHYVSHNIQLKDIKSLFKTPKPLLTFLAFPFGIALYLYVYYINSTKK